MFEGTIANLLKIDGIKGALIVSMDGLLIEGESTDRTINLESTAAMMATIYGSANNVSSEIFGTGATDMVTVEGPKGKIIISGAGEDAVLGVIADSNVNLGLIRIHLGREAKKVASML